MASWGSTMKMMTHFGKQYEKWFTYIVYPMTSWRMTAITLITIYLHDNPEHSNFAIPDVVAV